MVALTFMIARGNRDFMLGEQFAARYWGDAAARRDRPGSRRPADPYSSTAIRCARTTVTISSSGPWSIQLSGKLEMMSKSLQERRELARQLRSMSIDAASNKPEDIMDVNPRAVATAMEACRGGPHDPRPHPPAGAP